MGVESLSTRPPRVVISNAETAEDLSAQYNPEEIKEKIKVNYKELEVLGLSHKPLQYQNTDNYQATFTLGFDALSQYAGSSDTARARRFLMSLCYPRKSAQDVPSGAPPRVLFSWPQLISLTCVIDTLDFSHKRFNNQMKSVLWTVDVTIKETRLVRLYSEDVLVFGTLRS